MPVSKKRRVTQPEIYGIGSKVNQFIYTLVCNYMPNIRILAKVFLKIFCSQCCSCTSAYVRKRGITQPKIYGIGSKVYQFIYILICNYMPNIRILTLVIFSDILLTRLFIHSRKRGITPERQDQRRKKKIWVRLFFMYMPHIKFQDSSISGS